MTPSQSHEEGPRLQRRALVLCIVLSALLLLSFVVVVYALLQIWPAVSTPATATGSGPTVTLFGHRWNDPNVDVALSLVAVLTGALGSSVHAMTSLASYIGNNRLRRSWASWYVLRLPIGACLALVVYFVLRGGLLSVGTNGDQLNAYGVAAISCLSGMFSKQATDKLEEVVSVLFRTTTGGGDEERADKLHAAAPRPVVPPAPTATGSSGG